MQKPDESALEIFKDAMGIFDVVFTVAGAGIWEKVNSNVPYYS